MNCTREGGAVFNIRVVRLIVAAVALIFSFACFPDFDSFKNIKVDEDLEADLGETIDEPQDISDTWDTDDNDTHNDSEDISEVEEPDAEPEIDSDIEPEIEEIIVDTDEEEELPAPPPEIGGECLSASDCDSRLSCFYSVEGGYCSLICSEDEFCPDGSLCGHSIGLSFCIQSCRHHSDCTQGFMCGTVGDLNVCLPDADEDGVLNNLDNCENYPNPGQEDSDRDGLGDLCEASRHVYCPDDSAEHPDLPVPLRHGASLFSSPGNRVYHFGGVDPSGMSSDEIWSMDLTENRWRRENFVLPYPSSHQAAVEVNDKIFLSPGPAVEGGAPYNDLILIDIEAGQVSFILPLPSPLEQIRMVPAMTGEIFLFGYMPNEGEDVSPESRVLGVFRFDPIRYEFSEIEFEIESDRLFETPGQILPVSNIDGNLYLFNSGTPQTMVILNPLTLQISSAQFFLELQIFSTAQEDDTFFAWGWNDKLMFIGRTSDGNINVFNMSQSGDRFLTEVALPPTDSLATTFFKSSRSNLLFAYDVVNMTTLVHEIFPICFDSSDTDNDGVSDQNDNCPTRPNDGQDDLDGDGVGDLCERDMDADGILDGEDRGPNNEDYKADTDNDGLNNDVDPDDDGDTLSDEEDPFPLDTDNDGISNGYDLDLDNDGFSNQDEEEAGTQLLDPLSFPGAHRIAYIKLTNERRVLIVAPLDDLENSLEFSAEGESAWWPRFSRISEHLLFLSGSPSSPPSTLVVVPLGSPEVRAEHHFLGREVISAAFDSEDRVLVIAETEAGTRRVGLFLLDVDFEAMTFGEPLLLGNLYWNMGSVDSGAAADQILLSYGEPFCESCLNLGLFSSAGELLGSLRGTDSGDAEIHGRWFEGSEQIVYVTGGAESDLYSYHLSSEARINLTHSEGRREISAAVGVGGKKIIVAVEEAGNFLLFLINNPRGEEPFRLPVDGEVTEPAWFWGVESVPEEEPEPDSD